MRRIFLSVALVLFFLVNTFPVVSQSNCAGTCATIYTGGCILVCQQYACEEPGGIVMEYSRTTAICDSGVYDYGADYNYRCPCAN